MGRGKKLSKEEIAQIQVLHSENYSLQAIADKIGRSKTVIFNFTKNPSKYGSNNKGRIVEATSAADKRAILRTASNCALSCAKIKAKAGVEASRITVWRVIKKSDHLIRRKLQKKPPLNQERKQKRLDFSRQHMTWAEKWKRVVFSDEKKFNLDGPDGFNYYFHDLRKEENFLTKHHSREGGVMVWGAVSFYGSGDLSFPTGKMTAATYKGILEDAFPRFNDTFGPLPWIYQQDNAPIHTANIIKTWISQQNVELLPWPPYSPDLNIMENVWGWLSRKVYEGGRQFDNKESLIKAINEAWKEISLDYLKSLYDSISSRLYEVIFNKGSSTHY